MSSTPTGSDHRLTIAGALPRAAGEGASSGTGSGPTGPNPTCGTEPSAPTSHSGVSNRKSHGIIIKLRRWHLVGVRRANPLTSMTPISTADKACTTAVISPGSWFAMVYHGCGIPSYTLVCHTMVYHGIALHTMVCNMVYHGIPRYTMVYHAIPNVLHWYTPWCTMVHHVVTRYAMVYHGLVRGISWYIPWCVPRHMPWYHSVRWRSVTSDS